VPAAGIGAIGVAGVGWRAGGSAEGDGARAGPPRSIGGGTIAPEHDAKNRMSAAAPQMRMWIKPLILRPAGLDSRLVLERSNALLRHPTLFRGYAAANPGLLILRHGGCRNKSGMTI